MEFVKCAFSFRFSHDSQQVCVAEGPRALILMCGSLNPLSVTQGLQNVRKQFLQTENYKLSVLIDLHAIF